ncbi:MAG: DNA cytosine methyltransferase [Burkholderiaceae bacterium]
MALHTIEICAGIGMLGEGLRAGLAHLGVPHRTICYVEREAHAASVLVARMEEGSLDAAPVWSDLLSFDGAAWRGSVDCIAAGFPCQDLSLAGRRAGLDGARSGLFFDILHIAHACSARYLFLENVAGIASATASVVDEAEGALEERAAARVLGELADGGWDAEWLALSAADVGASHERARWFCLAWRRLGDTGLQHQHLQQRPDGAEHQGAGDHVAHAERAERRQISPGGVGSLQGNDRGRPEKDGCAGISGAVLGQPEGDGWQQRRPESAREPGRPDAAEHGGAVANTITEGRRSPQGTDGSGRPSLGEQNSARRSECGRDAVGRLELVGECMGLAAGVGLADTGKPAGRREQGRAAEQLCGTSLFAPGPADPAWAGIIAENPHLAPALEPTFRGVVNGLAFDMGDCRAARLKCVGNGVVALTAATAAVVLLRRAGFSD